MPKRQKPLKSFDVVAPDGTAIYSVEGVNGIDAWKQVEANIVFLLEESGCSDINSLSLKDRD